MQTIQEIQNQIIDEFNFFEDWSEKYQYLIDLGKNLPEFDKKSRIDSNLIKGCQSKVWLNSSFKNEELLFLGQIDGRAYENRRGILKKILVEFIIYK